MSCPYCSEAYEGYRIVGLQVANADEVNWLEERVPMALLFCRECGRATFMHPDHPDVQRLRPEVPVEVLAENVRTLNVELQEVGDSKLRQQFEAGEPE